jgi:hypothetical protein
MYLATHNSLHARAGSVTVCNFFEISVEWSEYFGIGSENLEVESFKHGRPVKSNVKNYGGFGGDE